MTSDEIRLKVKEYVLRNFVFEENGHLGDDQPLLKSGVIDSTGILELIAFAEEEFQVHFEDSELVGENFDSIDRVTACVARKLPVSASSFEKSGGE